jgi:2-oxo-4-hydroxy-4-carboxy-5-ureidoimidazoline decarboxylase
VRELPRQLSEAQLEELFGGDTPLVRHLAGLEDPLGVARSVAETLTEEEQIASLGAHPAIGAGGLTGRSAREQGTDGDPAVLAELAELNRAYEERFGFRFVVFVDRRPRSEIVPVLRERLTRSRADELATALDELVAIAQDRWRR